MADTSTVTSTNWLQPQWQQYLTSLQSALPPNMGPMPTYNGPQVAPQNPYQTTAGDMMYQFATNGTPAGNAANGAIVNQAGGVANPYAGQANPYQGVNPYTQQVINNTNQSMADAYGRGTAAQTDAAMARSGAYGGSAYNELTGANNQAFANAVGQVDSGLLNQNYYNNANLAENQINRQTQSFDNTQNRSLSAAGLGLSSQGVDQNAINGLLNVGSQNQANTQADINAMQNQFSNAQQANFIPFDIFGNGLSRASGASTTTTNSVPGSSSAANWAAAALMALGFFQ